MLFLSESEMAARRRLYEQIHAGTLTMEDGFRQVLEVDPDDYVAWLAVGVFHKEQGRAEEALRCFWRALEARPSQAECYSVLYDTLLGAGNESELAEGMSVLTLNRVLRDPESPRETRKKVLRMLRKELGLTGFDSESLVYLTGLLAGRTQEESDHVRKILQPYRLIQPVIDLENTGMPRETVDEILRLGEPCVNPLLGVVRAWVRSDPESPAPPTTLGAVAAVALLGETGSPAVLPALKECAEIDDLDVAVAAVWAAHRLASRYPAAAADVKDLPRAPKLNVYDFCLCSRSTDYAFHDQPVVPALPTPRPGRNDPCWCGSGKKYKKCHLASDEREDREQRARDTSEEPEPTTLDRRMTEVLLQFLIENVPSKEIKGASRVFLGDTPPEGGPEDVQAVFFDWLLHDYEPRRFGRPVAAEYLARYRHTLSPDECRELEERIASRHSLFEVQRVEPGAGIELRDLLLDETLFVHDISSSKSFVAWDCLLARVRDCGNTKIFTGNGLLVPRHICPNLRDWILDDQQDSGLDWPSYLRANSHRLRQECLELHEDWRENLQIRNRDNDPIVFSKARYRVLDVAALKKALESCPGLKMEEGPGDSLVFVWVDSSRDRTVLGRFELRGDSLLLECNSRPRLERGAELLLRLAGDIIRETGRDYQTLDEARRNYKPSAKEESEPPIPPEVEARVMGEHLEQHYSTWPDTSLPALDGLTPRQAAARPEMRHRLVDLLKLLENGELHKKREGRPFYDVTRLKSTLGIDY